MIPRINGKSFLECNEDDLMRLIDDPDFRENEYIDYKANFAFLEVSDKQEKNKKKLEFKNDICSFANAEGGYLIYGIRDEAGCAAKIVGIDIPDNNEDKFELERRNDLSSIKPRIPNIEFKFVPLKSEKYVVIIYIKHDSFAPYTHIEDQKNYKFFKRSGNEKTIMTYTELKNMFNQSISLDKEIHNYRTERIDHYRSLSENKDDAYSKFMLLHIIPDTFIDHDYNRNMYALCKTKHINFSSVFSEFRCNSTFIPCVDGLRFIPDYHYKSKSECYIRNNGIVECFASLNEDLIFINDKYPNGRIRRDYIWEIIEKTCYNYLEIYDQIHNNEIIYLCLSIIGSKGAVSQAPEEEVYIFYTGTIDRNNVVCDPVIIENMSIDFENAIKRLHIEYLLSIGVKHDKELEELIHELYS